MSATSSWSIDENDRTLRTTTLRVAPAQSDERSAGVITESRRWVEFIHSLPSRVATGVIDEAQRQAILRVWNTLAVTVVGIRYPAAGVAGDEGDYSLSWNYVDKPGRFVTVLIDRAGVATWIFRERAADELQEHEAAAAAAIPKALLTTLKGFCS